jgi:hypothetical protein
MNSADLKLKNALVGTWTRQTINTGGTLTLASDGTFKSGWTNLASKPLHSWLYEGYWTVTGGVWVVTETNSKAVGATNNPPLSTNRWQIITVDSQSVVWVSDGQTNSLSRKH